MKVLVKLKVIHRDSALTTIDYQQVLENITSGIQKNILNSNIYFISRLSN